MKNGTGKSHPWLLAVVLLAFGAGTALAQSSAGAAGGSGKVGAGRAGAATGATPRMVRPDRAPGPKGSGGPRTDTRPAGDHCPMDAGGLYGYGPGLQSAPSSGPPAAVLAQSARQPGLPLANGDASSWQQWWTYNKDAYLDLRARTEAQTTSGSDTFFLGRGDTSRMRDLRRPTRAEIEDQVVPALAAVLSEERDNELVRCSMVALAKIGRTPSSDLIRSLHDLLDHGSQSVAETAVISLGILARESAVPTLVSILEDDREGWRLVGKVGVPDRTRALAAYALGLVAARADDAEFRREIAARLIRILEQPHFSSRDIKIAAMTALGLTPLPVELSTSEPGRGQTDSITSRQAQLHFLEQYFDPRNERANAATRHWLVRAHAPTAMARLLDGAPILSRATVVDLLLEAAGRHSKEPQEVQQSCILALGQIGDSDGGDPIDTRIRAELMRTIDEGDQMSRRFALIALAQTGSRRGQGAQALGGLNETTAELLRQLARGENQLKPWAALALGILGNASLHQGLASDPSVVDALRSACAKNRRPDECGAFMIALGLHEDRASRDVLLGKLDLFAGSDDTRGDAAVALGLMEERGAIAPIQEDLLDATHRPHFLRQASIALGLLGDRQLVPELVTLMAGARSSDVQGSLASALGFIGDARSIEPLLRLLANERQGNGARAWAAVALGRVCDREALPWTSILSTDFNYNASPATLSDPCTRSGVLDLF